MIFRDFEKGEDQEKWGQGYDFLIFDIMHEINKIFQQKGGSRPRSPGSVITVRQA